jgi:hypothetical protein
MNKLTDEQRDLLRQWFLERTGQFVFRYVHNVTARPENIVDTEIVSISDDGKIEKNAIAGEVTAEDVKMTPREFEKAATPHFSRFFGFTKKTKLRENDPCDGSSIFINSSTCGFFNAPFLELIPRPGKRHRIPLPRPSHRDCRGDLVAGFVAEGEKGWHFTRWFICSEQFLTLWTLVLNPKGHESFSRGKELSLEDARRLLLDTNRLVTNPFKRWYDAVEDQRKDKAEITELQLKECRTRLQALRYEKGAKEYYHLYVCLAMMIHWGEIPSDDNVPNCAKELPLSKWWNLPTESPDTPTGWLPELLQKVAKFDI